jgi:TRAP-type C4-dicarboxylate transport system permease small subunit
MSADDGLRRVERWLDRTEGLCERTAAFLMLVTMLVVSADVVMRYALHRPIVWAYDLISVYLMAAVFFLALSAAYATDHQVAVDVVVRSLGPKGRRAAEALTCAVSLPLFLALAWVGAARAWGAWRHGDALAGLIAWPTWPALALVPLGSGLLAARLASRLAGHLFTLATGRPSAPLDPPHGGDLLAE